MHVFIDFQRQPYYFNQPETVISCYEPLALSDCFLKIEEALKKGFFVAGFVSYEAGYCFEERLTGLSRYEFPLLMMGVYRQAQRKRLSCSKQGDFKADKFRLNITPEAYGCCIDTIRSYIARGDVYQITYCIKFKFSLSGSPVSFYSTLLKRQPVPYPAYIDTGKYQIISLSPERFLKKNKGFILTQPMKGTWPRADTFWQDLQNRRMFYHDKKNRAENIMICDLLRNDLGRIGSVVRAPKLFTISGYNTLFQMTSTVTAKLDKDIPVYKLFSGLFPSGSVTGAPKIRAMEIIGGLETEPRKIYTGAIGYISPDRDMYFNIPIRTILIEGNKAEMGVGGGIVWDSTAQGEWAESMLKATFLTAY